VAQRRSIRAFTDTQVDTALIADILHRATRAPSGGNLQPWRLYVLNGPSMARFRALMETRMAENPVGEPPEYAVYPASLKEPYRTRRFQIGEAMYEKLGIARDDKIARLQWFQNNDRFFGAPAAAFCFTDRIMGPPQWSDLGMLLQTAMLLFEEAGLGTCPQEAWSRWPRTVAEFVGAPPELMLFCGLAIGYPDRAAPVNTLATPRAPQAEVISLV
jgi:nitroreductase